MYCKYHIKYATNCCNRDVLRGYLGSQGMKADLQREFTKGHNGWGTCSQSLL